MPLTIKPEELETLLLTVKLPPKMAATAATVTPRGRLTAFVDPWLLPPPKVVVDATGATVTQEATIPVIQPRRLGTLTAAPSSDYFARKWREIKEDTSNG